jgi:phage regulator Rha-like protein
MSNIEVTTKNDVLVVDSRLIAEDLGIEHHTFTKTLNKYLDLIESNLGVVRFEVDKPSEGSQGGRPEKYALLTEPQATLLMTFSKNTEQVINCKINLVSAFEKAKQIIRTVIPQQSEEIKQLMLQNQVLDKQLKLRELDNTMLTLHGKQVVLALRGYDQSIVEVEKPILEVIDNRTGDRRQGMTTKQLNEYLKQQTGTCFKSGSQIKQILERKAPELLSSVQRPVMQDWVLKEHIEQAIEILKKQPRQMLLGEG